MLYRLPSSTIQSSSFRCQYLCYTTHHHQLSSHHLVAVNTRVIPLAIIYYPVIILSPSNNLWILVLYYSPSSTIQSSSCHCWTISEYSCYTTHRHLLSSHHLVAVNTRVIPLTIIYYPVIILSLSNNLWILVL